MQHGRIAACDASGVQNDQTVRTPHQADRRRVPDEASCPSHYVLRSRCPRYCASSHSGFQISKNNAIICLELIERLFVSDIAAFPMRNRQVQNLSSVRLMRERRVGADNLQATVRQTNFKFALRTSAPGSRPTLGKHLKAIADAQHQAAISREFLDGRHNRRKFSDRAATKIISIGKPARKNDRVHIAKRCRIVPDELGLMVQVLRERVPSVVIAIAARKNDNADFHLGKEIFEAATIMLRTGGGTGRLFAGCPPSFLQEVGGRFSSARAEQLK